MSTHEPETVESVEPITGVRDLRSALQWYDDGGSRSSDGIPIQIVGVWNVICGQPHRTNGVTHAENITEMVTQLRENYGGFSDSDNLSESDIRRVVGLLTGLSEHPSEYRVYGEPRNSENKYDMPTRCYVGLYHVTEKTTIMCYQHTSSEVGMTTYTVTGISTPRKDIEDKLYDDVFYTSQYEYERLDD